MSTPVHSVRSLVICERVHAAGRCDICRSLGGCFMFWSGQTYSGDQVRRMAHRPRLVWDRFFRECSGQGMATWKDMPAWNGPAVRHQRGRRPHRYSGFVRAPQPPEEVKS